ncbi:peptide deformylase [Anaeromyxobacter oryzisoli]|uniref:peptide deformylase n=1 Tax=Anaeromyxobacter oryzisoli TaxID=2925408 RepID=UPI001F5878DA|nr:peptide deformylase [Anaeromyxobacter sp. SG63]
MVREIVIWPDPVLKQIAKPVDRVDDSIRRLLDDMAETMYAAEGVGLAAPQIGVQKRVIVIDTSPRQEGQRLLHLVNPEIVRLEGKTTYTEGCLSIPGEAEDVERAAKVWVRALDYHGKPFELEADDLLAIALQHETDHLNGTLFVDHLSSLKRELIRKRMKRLKADRAAEQRERAASRESAL